MGYAQLSKIFEGVEFTVNVSPKQVLALVTREYLECRYGARKERETWLLAFAKNRTVIIAAALEQYKLHPDANVIVLK